MNTLAPITLILLVFAVTISVVEDSILFGVIPFTLALIHEVLLSLALRPDNGDVPE